MKILIIEDDTNINNMLFKLLVNNGYEVIQAFSGTEGLMLINNTVSLVLLDLMLPGKNGDEVIKEIKSKFNLPIIVMSAISDVSKKLDLFSLGSSDYITKPFDNEELLARIKVHLASGVSNSNILVYKDITLNVEDYKVTVLNKNLDLTKNEFMLLKVLMENRNQVLTKDKLFRLVWDYNDLADDNTLNVHISKLRNKIKCITNEDYIETVWSIGYRLKK